MQRKSLVNRVKSSRTIYYIYYHLGNVFVNTLKQFVKADPKLVLFVSYGGRRFDDSPKEIYEAMQADSRFCEYHLVWAFIDPEKHNIDRGKKISINSIEYVITAIKARVWVTNVSIRRGLSFNGKHTLFVNSWHGTAIKHLAADCKTASCDFKPKDKLARADIMLAQGIYDVEVFAKAFNLRKSQIHLTGLPRNDSLVTGNNQKNIENLKKQMNLPLGKKIILYAPTFRESKGIGIHSWIQEQPFNLEKWQKKMGENFVLLIRGHHIVHEMKGISESTFVRDFSSYPFLNDLMLVSDILISDYSSIIFDYSILARPIICYTYDYDQYVHDRGVYFDIRTELDYEEEEDKLIDRIMKIDYQEGCKKTLMFRKKYVQSYGDASEKALNLIYKAIT